jgi:hypothetical protein
MGALLITVKNLHPKNKQRLADFHLGLPSRQTIAPIFGPEWGEIDG